MTSLKQIEANRRNAENSTGPRSEAGKQRSSRNAVRHGLTAETVIEPLEDAEDYAAFEEAIAAGFDPETAVERELILRLASLLWRLRRATSIETAVFQVKIEHDSGPQTVSEPLPPSRLVGIHVAPANIQGRDDVGVVATIGTGMQETRTALACYFLRVTNLADDAFERLGRYEAIYGARFGKRCSRLRDCVWAGPPSVIDARAIDGLLSQTRLLVGTSQKTLATDSVLLRVRGNDGCNARKSAGKILLRNLKVKQSLSIYAIQSLPAL